MKLTILYIALCVLVVDLVNAKSIKMDIFRERRVLAYSPQQPISCASGQCSNHPPTNRCPEMCVRWNTLLKSNGQLENTPAVSSPLVPGDTIRQCPQQCEARCCRSAASQTQAAVAQQPQIASPPACMAGCPRACYPACRPGCCNPPLVQNYQPAAQNYQPVAAQVAFSPQAVAPFAVSQPALPAQERAIIPQPAAPFYVPQPALPIQEQDRTTIPQPVVPYPAPQAALPIPIQEQQRATIPQAPAPYTAPQPALPAQGRSTNPQPATATHVSSCPVPCSPMCVSHGCTKHCCESYD